MIARFWGVRGSIPTPVTSKEIAAKVERAVRRAKDYDFSTEGAVRRFMDELPWHTKGTFGGNTPCVELECEDPHSRIVFDGGTGIRGLGLHLMEKGFSKGGGEIHLFLSHTHWDHIQGIPFFLPAYVSDNRVTIYSREPDIEPRVTTQQLPAYFPVSLKEMQADIQFVPLQEGQTVQIGKAQVSTVELNHPGRSYAFRVESNGASVVYASDTEFRDFSEMDMDKYVAFFSGAGVLIFDSQYFLAEAMKKEDWGHSSSLRGVDLAHEAGVATLVLFHHEPTYNDRTLWDLLHKTQKYGDIRGVTDQLEILMAHEGMELVVKPGR